MIRLICFIDCLRKIIGMNEINCPECGKTFTIDKTGYSNILKQVRDSEFKQELNKRLDLAEKDKLKSIELATKSIEINFQQSITNKNITIQSLKSKVEAIQIEKSLALE